MPVESTVVHVAPPLLQVIATSLLFCTPHRSDEVVLFLLSVSLVAPCLPNVVVPLLHITIASVTVHLLRCILVLRTAVHSLHPENTSLMCSCWKHTVALLQHS